MKELLSDLRCSSRAFSEDCLKINRYACLLFLSTPPMAGLDVGNDGWRSLSRPFSRKLKSLKDHEGFLYFILLLAFQNFCESSIVSK